jgi:hypothetical protein
VSGSIAIASGSIGATLRALAVPANAAIASAGTSRTSREVAAPRGLAGSGQVRRTSAISQAWTSATVAARVATVRAGGPRRQGSVAAFPRKPDAADPPTIAFP